MTGADPDLFVEPRLGFEIRKPRRWSFVPPAWSPVVQLRNAADEVRSYLIFTPGIAFTLGMSSSLDPKHYEEDDFTSVLSSIRIGRR